MRFRGENLGQNGLTHCDARHQIRDFCGQIAPPRPLPGQKVVWCRVMDLARGRLDIDGPRTMSPGGLFCDLFFQGNKGVGELAHRHGHAAEVDSHLKAHLPSAQFEDHTVRIA